jgi:hypothetical protein
MKECCRRRKAEKEEDPATMKLYRELCPKLCRNRPFSSPLRESVREVVTVK